jgi:hypothetical protein
VDLGSRRSVQPLLQSQQGSLKDCCWGARTPGSIVTASDDGSVCVWDAQVRCCCVSGSSRPEGTG